MTSGKRLIFITGRPGIGKTSVLLRALNDLKRRGYKIGGMISREVREGGIRVGFEIVDFCNGKRGWLAHRNQAMGPQIGKYRVNLRDLNAVGSRSILNATASDDIVVVDEIGPMELLSQTFRDAVVQAIESEKPLLGTIHYRLRDPVIHLIKTRRDAEILEVTYENRESLHKMVAEMVDSLLKAAKLDQSSSHKSSVT